MSVHRWAGLTRDPTVIRMVFMTTTLDSTPFTPLPEPAPARRRRVRTAGHIVAIVLGCFMALPGLGLLAGGGAALVGRSVAADDDGYFHVTLDRLESDGVAVAATDLWSDDVEGDSTPWVLDLLDVDLRLRVEAADAADEVFVGIARTADVERYLADAMFSQITDIEAGTTRYDEVGGTREIVAPTGQEFWSASASGPGSQQLDWAVRGGRWSVVLMNADGATGVDVDVEVGARSGALTPVAITIAAAGGLLLVGAIVLIVLGARGRMVITDPTSAQRSPLPPPAIGDGPTA